MKKLVFFAFIFILLFNILPKMGESYNQGVEEEYEVIPDEAIRLRILANSDYEKDQQIKHMVRDEVNKEISEWVQHISDIDEARKLIKSRIPEIYSTVINTINQAGVDQKVEVDYGENVTFPVKMYGSYLYPAGDYEAVLITIGEGNGANWWCVLFPPLCFLDFSNGMSVADEDMNNHEEDENTEGDDVKVEFFLFEWLGWT